MEETGLSVKLEGAVALGYAEDKKEGEGIDLKSNVPADLEVEGLAVKLSESSLKEIISSEEETDDAIIKIGTLGDQCRCFTNFVKLKQTANVTVFEYSVTFKPALESRLLKMRMIKQLELVVGPVNNFDGHTLYLPHKLNEDGTPIFVKCVNPKTNKEVKACIKFIKAKRFEELCNFYNILFHRILIELGFLEIKNGFYEVSELRELPNHKLQIWPGISLNVEIKDEGVVVMLGAPKRYLRTDTAYDYYKSMQDAYPENYKRKFRDYIIGKIVRCHCTQKCYKIDDVTWDVNPTSEFPYRQKMISYKDYFKMQYYYNIKVMDQPMLISQIKPKGCSSDNPNATETARANAAALPSEICHLTGLTSDHENNNKIKEEIATIIRQNPTSRLNLIRSIIDRIMQSEHAKKIFKEWGITLSSDVVEVIGRKLPPPTISFQKGGEGIPAPYYFRKECLSCYEAVTVNRYLVYCTTFDQAAAKTFIAEYAIACVTLGIKLKSHGEVIVVPGNKPHNFVKELEKSCVSIKPDFVVIILPATHERDVYNAVKKLCLTVVPIPSQCITSTALLHRQNSQRVTLNVCMQINCKLGGSLWGLNLQLKKLMFIGMDAAHDPSRKNPSIIALVASLNDTSTSYYSRCFPLPIHQEVNICMRTMFMDALKCYKQRNGHYPDHIIFYRDGGFSQSFDLLKKYEVEECLQVLKEGETDQERNTKFSYVCVAKRIPQRLLLQSSNKDVINPIPGTVVDTSITKPSLYDFYLVSQLPSQGTVSPTHYTVLHETKHTKPDVMQGLATATTFMYYNWPGVIKVPAVIEYSHKLGQLVSRVKEIPSRALDEKLYFL